MLNLQFSPPSVDFSWYGSLVACSTRLGYFIRLASQQPTPKHPHTTNNSNSNGWLPCALSFSLSCRNRIGAGVLFRQEEDEYFCPVKDTFHFYSHFIRFAGGHNFYERSILKEKWLLFYSAFGWFGSFLLWNGDDMKNKMKIPCEKYLHHAN